MFSTRRCRPRTSGSTRSGAADHRQAIVLVLGVVLRTVRDRFPTDLSAHLGAELPLLMRGAYYDQFRPSAQPADLRDLESFVQRISRDLSDARPVDARDALRAVLAMLSRHIPRGQIDKVQQSMPRDARNFWRSVEEGIVPPTETGAGRREARPN